MTVIYEDIESTLVAHLQNALGSEVRVGTKKLGPDQVQPAKQVVVTAAWAGDKERMLKYAGVITEVFADGDIEASTLALLVEANLRTATVGSIKKVEIIAGPIRLADGSTQEKRSISAEVTVQATNL
jgi:hypothetical protein